VIQGRPL